MCVRYRAQPRAQGGEPELRQLLAGLTAVRDGDFGTRLPDGADGLLGEIATVFNGMVDQLSLVTSEVTRVAARWARRAPSAARPGSRRLRHLGRPQPIRSTRWRAT